MRQLLSSALPVLAAAASSGATTTVTGTTIDTLGYGQVTILAALGAITSTGVPTLKAQGGAASDGGDKADISGASVVGDDTMGGKFLAIEIHKPKQRYITPVLSRATANIAVNSIIVILSNPSNTPVDLSSQVASRKSLVSPALA